MPLQTPSSSPIAEFAALLRRRWWSILLPFAFVTALGTMAAQLMPRQYKVTTIVKLSEVTMPGAGSAIQRDVNSAKNDLKTEPMVRSVIESMEWPDYVGLTEKEKLEYIRRVTANITPMIQTAGKNLVGSSYILISYVDSDSERAASFLNKLRDRYLESVVAAVRADAKASRDKLKELRGQHESEYREAEKAKAKLLKEYNLSATQSDVIGQPRSEDPAMSRLVASELQRGDAERSLKEEQARLEFTRRLFEAEPETVPEAQAAAVLRNANPQRTDDPTANVDKQIRDLEIEIVDLRAKLADYRPIHSSYIKTSEQIVGLEDKIRLLRGDTGPAAPNGRPMSYVANPQRALYEEAMRDSEGKIATLEVTIKTLTTTINELRQEVNERQDVFLQLRYLNQAVATAQATYMQTDDQYQAQCVRFALLSGPEANPYDVVEVALASDEPESPNVPLFIAISAALGLALGLGSALAGEFLRNGYRSAADLTRGLGAPVLGAVNLIVTRAEKRRSLTRNVMIAVSSAVIIGAILWVTWAYQHDSLRLLGPRLTQAIDDVRLAFRP